uniref:Uncharacterized protein n=1 Tax=Rhipicephalus zambeziensis TaxID=60191 RepID=A0A224Y848_9ACAR
MSLTDEELERLAREEILRETKRGAERAKDHGAYGWEKPRVHPTNKNFLKNTILSTLVGRRGGSRENTKRESGHRPEKDSSPVHSEGKSARHQSFDDRPKKQSQDRREDRRVAADKSDRKRTHDGVRKKKQ